MKRFTFCLLFFAATIVLVSSCKTDQAETGGVADTDEVFIIVEEMPRFPGCNPSDTATDINKCAERLMLKHLYSHLIFPDSAFALGVEGNVVVQFVVEKDGTLSNFELVKDIGGNCGKEALRVAQSMNNMPEKWIPGKKDGKAVRVKFTLPVKFVRPPLGDDGKPMRNEGAIEQSLYVAFVFCRDFAGDFVQKNVLDELASQPFDDKNLCAPGVQLQRITLTYEEEGKTTQSVRSIGWNDQVKALLKKAQPNGVLTLDYTVEKDGKTATFKKTLLVEE